MDLMTYLLATQNGGGSDLPEVTSADNGKVLKVKDGVWNKGDDVSGDNLPPVSSADNGKILKVIDAEWNIGEDEGGVEAVELTQSQYDELSTAEKEDPTKVYFINTGTPTLDPRYAYHTNQDETLIYRCKADDGSEGMWFLNGFEVTSLTNTAIPTELRQYAPGGNGKVSDAWADTNGTPFLVGGKQCYAGIYNNTVRIWSNNGTTNQLGTIYAVIDMRLDNRQYNEWSDPYIYTTDRNHKIYYKDIKYSVSIPDSTIFNNGKILRIVNGAWSIDDETTELPEVTGSDNGKILKVNNGAWSAGDEIVELPSVTNLDAGKVLKVNDQGIWDKSILPNTAEPVVKTKTQYDALSQSQKEDPTKIYFIDPDTFDSGIARVSGVDSHITASQEYRPAWYAFTNDVHTPGSDDTGWCGTNISAETPWLKYHFDSATIINKVKFSIFSRNSNSWSGNIYVEGSDDDTNWDNLLLDKEYISASVTNKDAAAINYVEFCNGGSYNYFRIRFSGYSNYALCFQRVDISSSVIEYAAIYYIDSKYSDLTPPTKELPKVTSADNGKVLKVTNGAWDKGDSDAYVALTQAQYDALPSSKLTDGKMYCITDQDARELPEVTVSDNDKVLKVINGEWNIGVDSGADTVTQSPSTTDRDYEVLFSGSADNTEHTERVKKSTNFKFNPSTGTTTIYGQLTIGSRLTNSEEGRRSFVQGFENTASGSYSHAEGYQTIASGDEAYAEGNSTTASGRDSHAEGQETTASGNFSHAEGNNTTAQRRSQRVFGEYNILDTTGAHGGMRGSYVEIVGNGDSTNRSNARTLDWDGNEWVAGTYTNGSSRKIKTNIESLTNTEALKILDLNPVKFDFIKTETNDQRERGFIAEEVMNVIPQIAFEEETDDEGNITKPASLNYIGLMPYLVKMIQIQQQEIDELKEQINN